MADRPGEIEREAIDVRPARDEDERAALAPIMGWSFGHIDPEKNREWVGMYPPGDLWVAVEPADAADRAERLLGGLGVVRGAQHWGGRVVPWVGLSGVCTVPEARGRGVSQRLVGEVLRTEARAGRGLAALYPASLSLYRKCGFELAGVSSVVRLNLAELAPRKMTHAVREVSREEVVAAWQAFGPRDNGTLAREAVLWTRLWRRSPGAPKLFGLFARDELRAVVGLAVVDLGRRFDLTLKLWAARDRAAVADVIELLRAHGTLGIHAEWWGAPIDALVADLSEERWSVTRVQPWMLRVLAAETALAARGYPAGMSARLGIAIADPIVGDTAIELVVEDGVGRVAACAGERVELTVGPRGLAALYAGARSAESLAASGLVAGEAAALRTASALFAGPNAWIPEMF